VCARPYSAQEHTWWWPATLCPPLHKQTTCRSPALIKPHDAANPAIPDPDLSESATDARFQHETLASACICADLRPETQFAQTLRSADGALLLCIEQSRLGRASTYYDMIPPCNGGGGSSASSSSAAVVNGARNISPPPSASQPAPPVAPTPNGGAHFLTTRIINLDVLRNYMVIHPGQSLPLP